MVRGGHDHFGSLTVGVSGVVVGGCDRGGARPRRGSKLSGAHLATLARKHAIGKHKLVLPRR